MQNLSIAEGVIFWTLDSPTSDESNSQSKNITGPTLFFIHAGVADHTLWDDQVKYCTSKGWHCLRYDLFGYGQSTASEAYLAMNPRTPVRHHDQAALVVEAMFNSRSESQISANPTVIVIALSRGALIAVDFALSHPTLVSGLVLCAGGLSGLDIADTADEDLMFGRVGEYMDKKDVVNAAKTNVRIWGDGTQTHEGRVDEGTREKLYNWCKSIAQTELDGEGGGTIPCAGLSDPPAAKRLSDIKVKTMVAIGKYDESSTNATMRYAAQHIKGATLKEFEAAHMINLECPTEFNNWLGAYLDQSSH